MKKKIAILGSTSSIGKSLLDIIKNKKILKENGIILIHRDKKDLDQFPNDFKILITKNYGRSKIIFGKFN